MIHSCIKAFLKYLQGNLAYKMFNEVDHGFLMSAKVVFCLKQILEFRSYKQRRTERDNIHVPDSIAPSYSLLW